MKNGARYIVTTYWGTFSLDEASYQDYLASGKESRINLPSSLSNANWTYRFLKDEFTNEVQSRISRLISAYNR